MHSRCAYLLTVLALFASPVWAADVNGLKSGTPELLSAGPLAFGPTGVLLIGDPKAAAVVAIQTGDVKGDPAAVKLNIGRLNEKIAKSLSASPAELSINDLVVNPTSGNVYISVSYGEQKEKPAIVRVNGSGEIAPVELKDIEFARVILTDAPADAVVGEGRRRRNLRDESITDLAFTDSKVLVSGLIGDKGASSVRTFEFPFVEAQQATPIEIYHAAHGKVEDYAPIRVFVPFNIGGKPNLLAGFTCTPLVKFPIEKLGAGEKIRGTTVAELGNRNKPLDMIVYEKEGKTYLLMSNSARGVMKVSTEDIERNEGLTEPVKGGGTAGQSYATVQGWTGVVQLDKLNDTHAVVLIDAAVGAINLKTVELP
jgi:hypothetical protein